MNQDYLWQKLGNTIQAGLLDPDVTEVMLNPDQTLWFKRQQSGNTLVGKVSAAQSNAFVHALAQSQQQFLNEKKPYLDAVLPFQGERINVTVPPVSEAVSFNIRKKATVIFSLEDYVTSEVLTPQQASVLKQAIIDRRNILISGSPAAGKTTFANALLEVMAKTAAIGHRVMLLEQVAELQCPVKNLKRLQVTEHVSMNTLLWLCMRNSPDRIVVGEVRDGAALEMLKAWNTGCRGGIATIHANSARAAVQRVLDLSCEVVSNPPVALAAESLDVIVHIEECPEHPAKRVVTEVISVRGFDHNTQQFQCKSIGSEENYL